MIDEISNNAEAVLTISLMLIPSWAGEEEQNNLEHPFNTNLEDPRPTLCYLFPWLG